MNFSNKNPRSIERLSYLLMLVIFSAGLYFILSFTEKIPKDWGYLHILFGAIILVLISRTIKKVLS